MNLQNLRIESLCQQFKVDTFATNWPVLAQQAAKKNEQCRFSGEASAERGSHSKRAAAASVAATFRAASVENG